MSAADAASFATTAELVPAPGDSAAACAVACLGQGGCNAFLVDDGCHLGHLDTGDLEAGSAADGGGGLDLFVEVGLD